MRAARERYGKGDFSLGLGETTAVDQAVWANSQGNFPNGTPPMVTNLTPAPPQPPAQPVQAPANSVGFQAVTEKNASTRLETSTPVKRRQCRIRGSRLSAWGVPSCRGPEADLAGVADTVAEGGRPVAQEESAPGADGAWGRGREDLEGGDHLAEDEVDATVWGHQRPSSIAK